MKKVMALVCVAALAVSSVFAGVELGLSGSYAPSLSFDCNVYTEPLKASVQNSKGAALDLSWYFFSAGMYEVGINTDATFIMGDSFTASVKGDSQKSPISSHTLMGRFGPAIRFNLNEKNCFVLEPGLRAFITGGSVDVENPFSTSMSLHGTIIDVGLGYRHWLVNTNGFHMGLGINADFGKPLKGSGSYIEGEFAELPKLKVQKGFTQRYSIGLFFNFGKTGYDKAQVEAVPASSETVGTPAFDRSEIIGKWTPFEDKNKKAEGYFEFNEDGTGYFKYVPDGKNAVVDGTMTWQLIEKGGKTYIKIAGNKENTVNKEWECSLDDGILMFKKQVCFGLYPNNKWTKE